MAPKVRIRSLRIVLDSAKKYSNRAHDLGSGGFSGKALARESTQGHLPAILPSILSPMQPGKGLLIQERVATDHAFVTHKSQEVYLESPTFTLNLFRGLLREASYLPDQTARKFFRIYIVQRFRARCTHENSSAPRRIEDLWSLRGEYLRAQCSHKAIG